MNPERVKRYINRMLEMATQYEQEGNKEKAEYWLTSAEEFEKRMSKQGEN